MDENSDDIQKQIEQRIGKLPADIQNAIFAVDFNDKITAIGNTAKLHVDQIQELNDLTMAVMLGFMNEDEYQKEITALAEGDAAVIQKILHEVNSQIFLSIRESMKRFAAGEVAPAPVAVSASSSKPPLSEILPKGNMPQPTVAEVKPSFDPIAAAPTPIATPAMPIVAPPIMPAIPSVSKIEMHPADIALTEKTVAMPPSVAPTNTSSGASAAASPKAADAKAVPPKPTDYKADPYREPIN